ncbi:MAG: nitroreductase family protein [Rikenellaceae bacterium]|nr:nitroreductase family protein [Rikenellaceae bacterium]
MIKEFREHRSYRKYGDRPVEEEVLRDILSAGTRASTCGNMQLYSMVVTRTPEVKQELLPCHFGQPMVTQAPVVITFCADTHRFAAWCRQRGAEPGYDNFMWFVNGVVDAMLAAENVATQAEAHGLGVCFLGTTLYTADRIIEVLHLPEGVVPVTTVVMGYPDGEVPLTDRLPLEAVVHEERYREYTPESIDRFWAEKEALPETQRLLEENGLPNLARIFTERRYTAADGVTFSKALLAVLEKQRFWNH